MKTLDDELAKTHNQHARHLGQLLEDHNTTSSNWHKDKAADDNKIHDLTNNNNY